MENVIVNRKYKDTLFAALFGRVEHKNEIIDLYNVLNGTSYPYTAEIEIVTIENTVYLGMHNDAAFLIDNETISLWEEQSTWNPNMPLRGLIYLVQEYRKLIGLKGYDIYGPTPICIPTPKYVVFYIGSYNQPNTDLKLSDLFVDPSGGCVELKTRIVNINYRGNDSLLRACKMLHDYTALIRKVRHNKEVGMDINEAVDLAVQECINEGILREYLLKHREEATDMILTEYNEKEHLKNVANYNKEQGIEQGRKQGFQQGLEQGRREQTEMIVKNLIQNLLKKDPSLSEAVARTQAFNLLGLNDDQHEK